MSQEIGLELAGVNFRDKRWMNAAATCWPGSLWTPLPV
jgi:hypothetical protein